ncbi:MAG: molybdopterin-synthase adenylyltransferase MoeB [Gammaproteobacteria bacterium]|nr:MAG: molybdopterin-synthase adenylyltransferase MoeB [Gammaproteobacteria bacterium]RKZ97191.1 MAG: molybdopterin-synthase adenylyltransferase MoeB [Gammaproteobacteria bacterium]RLA02053.1 MAG: molybdopterin-synthase adenylyltransferase MoeB [Gammaproteobacteria bacterium]
MNDEQLFRYSRQILLPQIDFDGQQKLLDSHVLIIGLGGLGSPVAMYLAAAGIGKLTLVDDDAVELSNLQRQIVHTEQDLDRLKVESAADSLLALNSGLQIEMKTSRLTKQELSIVVEVVDVVVDCSDNFATRFLLNEVTQELKTPLVSGAAIRMEGQVTVYDPRQSGSACYRCLYQDNGELQQTCSEIGVLSPLLGIIGSVQAVETVKLIAGIGETLAGRLLILDALSMTWQEIKLRQDPHCPICNKATQ